MHGRRRRRLLTDVLGELLALNGDGRPASLMSNKGCYWAVGELELGNGKRRRRYRLQDYCTPYEKLLCLDNWEQHLKAGISAELLEQQALRMSDTACARNMQQATRKLLAQCRSRW